MSKVTAINEIIEKKNLLRKCQEKHANYVSIDAILVWLDNIKKRVGGFSNMEAGQLLVLLLSFCALALHIKNRRRNG